MIDSSNNVFSVRGFAFCVTILGTIQILEFDESSDQVPSGEGGGDNFWELLSRDIGSTPFLTK